MKLSFAKMHGCGNDYIYIDTIYQKVAEPEKLSRVLSDRRCGIGGDGIVLICPSDIADAKMRIFNADGSEAKMCGNAIRCVARFLLEQGIVSYNEMSIETLSGVKHLTLKKRGKRETSVRVDMGPYTLSPKEIPVLLSDDQICDYPLRVAERIWPITCVSMGNPHCVTFCEKIDDLDLAVIGPEFEHNPLFPDRINTEFIEVVDDHTLRMRVWERGSGETWACGTGACASVVAAVIKGIVPVNEPITVHLRGGDLCITVTETTVYMEGEAKMVYHGEIDLQEVGICD